MAREQVVYIKTTDEVRRYLEDESRRMQLPLSTIGHILLSEAIGNRNAATSLLQDVIPQEQPR